MPSTDGYLRALLSFSLAMTLVSCGKFEAAKPDPEQILYIKNELPFLDAQLRAPPKPEPIPELDFPDAPYNGGLGTPLLIDPNIAPNRPFGRLEYTKSGESWVCSAEMVGNTGDVALTAAHCVYDNQTGRWNSAFVLNLGYDSGAVRQSFSWECTAIFSGWPHGAWAKDYAFVKLRGAPADAGLGLRTQLPPSVFSFGYPSNFDGTQRLYKVDGQPRSVSTIPNTVGMLGNPFGKGASGGAWVDGNFAVGVNSFLNKNVSGVMYGPIFDGRTTQLYEFVRRGCQDDVIPLGKDPRIASYAKDKTYVEVDNKVVTYGPSLSRRKSAACPCQNSEEWYIENGEKDSYNVEMNYVGSTGNPPSVVGADKLAMRVQGNKPEPLGCTFGDKDGNNCPVETRFSVLFTKRLVDTVDARGAIAPTAVSPEFCQYQCTQNLGGGFCRRLGDATKPIVASLASFAGETLDRAPNANGVTTTIKELVTTFGGDPNTPDPCARSDFYRKADEISNDGLACITTTPAITEGPNEVRMSLRSPSQSRVNRVVSMGAVGSAGSFTNRNFSPVLEFHGDHSDELNRRFGGHVVNVERRIDKLIITTANGCSVGDVQ